MRIENIKSLLDDVLDNKVPGDFAECGVWRGGASLFARAVFAARGVTNRKVPADPACDQCQWCQLPPLPLTPSLLCQPVNC